MPAGPRHCEICGTRIPDVGGVPTCPDHGPRWCMVRSAPCTGTVIYDERGHVLLSRRARDPFAGLWEVPGGFVELGEHPADAARREVREEMGLELTVTGLVGLYSVASEHSGWLLVICFAGTVTGEPSPDPAEVADWRWFPPDDIPPVMAGDHRQRVVDWIAGTTVPLPAGGVSLHG